MKKLLMALAVLVILVLYLPIHQITFTYTKQMDTVPEYIEKCVESKQYFLGSILCNYEASKVINCEKELCEIINEFMQLKIKQVRQNADMKGEKGWLSSM